MTNDPLIGMEPLGQYRIEKKIGEGGFGAVYVADQLGVGRKAVIKVLRPRLASSEVFIQRFRREATVLAALDHHHLVRLYNFGELETGELFLAMEYGGDATLADIVKAAGPLSPDRAFTIGMQVCEALQEAHDRGIVHRDLKPQNILLGRKGTKDWAKVVDVGIAKLLDGADVDGAEMSLTRTGAIIGTPAYFSPEQARGLAVDGRSDVYSLGVVVYEMLTGTLPVHGVTPTDFIRAHAVDAPAPMRQHGLSVPSFVEAVVLKALQKDPAKRQQSAAELRDDLQRARDRMFGRGPGRSRRAVFGAAAAIALVLLGGGAVALLRGSGEKPRRDRAVAAAAPVAVERAAPGTGPAPADADTATDAAASGAAATEQRVTEPAAAPAAEPASARAEVAETARTQRAKPQPPPSASESIRRAKELMRQNNHRTAALVLHRLLRTDPSNATAHLLIGSCYARLRDVAKGAEHYRKFLALQPDDPNADKVREMLRQYDEAKSQAK